MIERTSSLSPLWFRTRPEMYSWAHRVMLIRVWRGGETARAARRGTGARDLSRRPRGGDIRRSPRRGARSGPDRRSGGEGSPGAAAAADDGPAPRRRGQPLHRGVRRRGPSPPARLASRAGPGRHRRRRAPLAVARVPDRVGAVGGRDLGRAGDPPGPRCPGDRRPRRPPPRPHLPLRHARPRRRVRRGGGPDPGVGRDHEIDRRRAPHVHEPGARRLARPRGPGRGPHRSRRPGCDPQGRGPRALLGRLRHGAASQRSRRLRRRAHRRPGRLCARRPRSRRLGDGRAGRGGRPQRPSRRRRRHRGTVGGSRLEPAARTGRWGWKRAPAPC
jgi:hypothetical protein